MSFRSYKRRNNWSKESETLLVQLWKENFDTLRKHKRRTHIYEDMGKQMRKSGFYVTGGEVKTKIHNLTNKYRNEKASVGEYSTWPHYQAVEELVLRMQEANDKDASFDGFEEAFVDEPKSEIEDFCEEVALEIPLNSLPLPKEIDKVPNEDTSIRSTTDTPPPAKRKRLPTNGTESRFAMREPKTNVLDKILNLLDSIESSNQKFNEQTEKTTEQLIKLEKRKVELLEVYVQNTCQAQSAFMDYLSRQE